ncbi:MAG: hypothetical protein AB1405_15960 [Bdellovibrionota bacterium]
MDGKGGGFEPGSAEWISLKFHQQRMRATKILVIGTPVAIILTVLVAFGSDSAAYVAAFVSIAAGWLVWFLSHSCPSCGTNNAPRYPLLQDEPSYCRNCGAGLG